MSFSLLSSFSWFYSIRRRDAQRCREVRQGGPVAGVEFDAAVGALRGGAAFGVAGQGDRRDAGLAGGRRGRTPPTGPPSPAGGPNRRRGRARRPERRRRCPWGRGVGPAASAPLKPLANSSIRNASPKPLCAWSPPSGRMLPGGSAYRALGSVVGCASASRIQPGGDALAGELGDADLALRGGGGAEVQHERPLRPAGHAEAERDWFPAAGASRRRGRRAAGRRADRRKSRSPCRRRRPVRHIPRAARDGPTAGACPHPTPTVFALSIRRFVRSRPSVWPKPQPPSQASRAGVSLRTVSVAPGTISPRAMESTYCGSRITPCESCPHRFAATRLAATASASSAVAPAAVRRRAAKPRSAAAETGGTRSFHHGGTRAKNVRAFCRAPRERQRRRMAGCRRAAVRV